MTQPLDIPEFVKIYFLVKQDGMLFSPTGSSGGNYLGTGFYLTRTEAEHNRTMEYLRETDSQKHVHIFELDVPNPAYKHEKNT